MDDITLTEFTLIYGVPYGDVYSASFNVGRHKVGGGIGCSEGALVKAVCEMYGKSIDLLNERIKAKQAKTDRLNVIYEARRKQDGTA